MYNGKYKIAGCVIEIRSLYDEVQALCHGYECEASGEASPELLIEITEADIENERERSAREEAYEAGNGKIDDGECVRASATQYPAAYLETLAVYRKLCEYIVSRDGFLFHGSALAFDGQGCIFTAKSGTGKSTHTALWRKVFGKRVVMINDDKPIILLGGEEAPTVCGTPWNGKHGLGSNICVPLRAICFLERGERNQIVELDGSEVFYRLLGQTFRPSSAEALKKTLILLSTLCRKIKFYKLCCNMQDEAATVSKNMIFGEKV